MYISCFSTLDPNCLQIDNSEEYPWPKSWGSHLAGGRYKKSCLLPCWLVEANWDYPNAWGQRWMCWRHNAVKDFVIDLFQSDTTVADIAQGEAGAEDTNITILYNMIRHEHCLLIQNMSALLLHVSVEPYLYASVYMECLWIIGYIY